MYQVGERVIYGIHGVCNVLQPKVECVKGKEITYLALKQTGQEGARFYVPVHNAVAMGKLHKIPSKDEVMMLLHTAAEGQRNWISEEITRKQIYRELINSGECEKLVNMIAILYRHKQEQSALGKKMHLCDENFLRDAEKILSGLISIVMNKSISDARQFLKDSLT